MTGQEILDIIEENYSVSSFAFDELTETKQEIELTPEEIAQGEKIGKEKQAFYDSIESEISDLQWSERQKHPKFKEYAAMPSQWDYQRNLITSKLGLGIVVEVDQYGGEDQGSTWYSVKHFVDHDVYIRTDGYYQSYNGTDFHDGYGSVVTPQKKTITVFE